MLRLERLFYKTSLNDVVKRALLNPRRVWSRYSSLYRLSVHTYYTCCKNIVSSVYSQITTLSFDRGSALITVSERIVVVEHWLHCNIIWTRNPFSSSSSQYYQFEAFRQSTPINCSSSVPPLMARVIVSVLFYLASINWTSNLRDGLIYFLLLLRLTCGNITEFFVNKRWNIVHQMRQLRKNNMKIVIFNWQNF